MEPDETLTVAVEADMRGFERTLAGLTGKADAFGTAFGNALQRAVTGGRSLDGVLKQLAIRLSTIALGSALKPLENLAARLAGGLFSSFGGGVASGAVGAVMPFAKGGVVAAPAYFPAGGRIGLMGEAGAEAVLPLARAADGTLGLAAPGPGGSRAPQIVFNVQAADAESFRRSEAQIQTMLARAVSRGRRGL